VIHELKAWPEHFNAVRSGEKKCEVRRADRPYSRGDVLVLQEYVDTADGGFTGEVFAVWITHILRGGQFGIAEDYVVLSIEPHTEADRLPTAQEGH
jgi:hypothetical protein